VTRREAWLTALAIFVVAVVARVVASAPIVFPKPEDTAYYVGVARNLLDGRGLVSDAIWSYQTPPLVFPRPAFEVWLPLPTFLAALPMSLLGPSSLSSLADAFRAAQWSSIVVGALVPVLAWRLAADVANERLLPMGRARTLAVGTGITCAVYLPLLFHSALPDSTMPFAVLALAACVLMTSILREPVTLPVVDRRLIALGVIFGLAALTRNEALWLGLTWAVIAWTAPGLRIGEDSSQTRLRAILVPALVAVVVFAPWAIRDWVTFGSPLPGQAAANALSVSGTDIFAWQDPPTLARYLGQGVGFIVSSRIDGFLHNLLNVLVYLGVPVSIGGLAALPWTARGSAVRPLVLFSLLTFAATTLLFPVSTTWGTFLHAAGPIHVLLVLSVLIALDSLIARVGRWRGWTRPVAWLGPAFAIFGSIVFAAIYLPTFGGGSAGTARGFAALDRAMAVVGRPLETSGPVITDFPIWLAEADRANALALPNESPPSVLDLARTFSGTRTLVVWGNLVPRWPAALDTHEPGSECFREITLPPPTDAADRDALDGVRIWAIECP
jgi:hypothetical protein